MFVRKRSGNLEPINLEKITNSINRACEGLNDVDVYKIAVKTVGGIYDGVTTKELDTLSIQTAVGFTAEDPIYSTVAARLLANFISKEVENQEIHSFSQSIQIGYENGLIGENTYQMVTENKRKLNSIIKPERDHLFEYFGLKTIYDRYLLRHPTDRTVIEAPQYFLLRVACGLTEDVKEAIEFYNLISSLEYMTATPTLFNSGTKHPQMSSCYLLDSPIDDLRDIEKRRADIALLSKWAGGIGLSYSRVRGSGALIKGTNGKSNGIIPFLHSLDANIAAINQGGRRKGSACVYLDTWHPDIFEFLELRDNTGDPEKRAYNLNLANWIPDLFMQRVKQSVQEDRDVMWSLIDPNTASDLPDLFGEEFEKRYLKLEAEKKYVRQVPARDLFARMMRTLSETGNGWINFRDTSNLKCNTAVDNMVLHSSNLCTEILQPTSAGKYIWRESAEMDLRGQSRLEKYSKNRVVHYDAEQDKFMILDGAAVSVCNLGSIAIHRYIKDGKLDKAKLRKNVALAVKFLDKVIDRNYYPINEAAASNLRLRPVGLGLMGLQDLFFNLRIPFESDEAVRFSAEIQEEIYYQALKTSCELAQQLGKHSDFERTHAAKGTLQFDMWNVKPKDEKRWNDLKADIKKHGLRNSLTIAIAPTVTISAITGSSECIEPQVSNLFKRETLSGEFIVINKYLIEDLKKLNLWNGDMLNTIKANEGSVQNITSIPENIRNLYKTVWEMKQKWLIDHAAARGAFIDQSQSLNLFMESPSIEKLSSMYFYVFEKGLKTSYYLRSRSATKINKTTVTASVAEVPTKSLEAPEVCESCT
jgi:ribonucleoside-diphosphate reductase alpha chain